MRRLLPLALLVFLALAAPAAATDVPDGATWTEATIPSSDGVELHADILRPSNLPKDAKTPVILSIGPYFNHAGQTGAVGPAQGTSYDPVGPSTGPSDRFNDLIEGGRLMERGYTFVMVDLRGFGGSNGCLDWGGPGEQADVVNAVQWAANADGKGLSTSTGAVGMYGKSYDAVTGLVGVNKQPAGLKAVVAQEPVYDLYRYLYGDGIRRANSVLTPALYDGIAGTPGPLADDPNYTAASLNDPACLGQNFATQAANDDHASDFWTQRNLIPGAKGSDVPLFLTQGLTENNTVADGMAQYLDNHPGPERAWLGPWEHVRGAETDEDGRLLMGRAGWYDEVMRFYDRYLQGRAPAVSDPPIAVQNNTGTWRAEQSWPPADGRGLTTALRAGEYQDTGQSFSTGSDESATSGVWTISPPLKRDAMLAGSGRVTLDVTTQAPRANLVVDVYELDENGSGPLITRQGRLLRDAGQQKVELDLWSADWKIPAGNRIAIRVTETNLDWWLLTLGTQQTVTVNGGSTTLPFLRCQRGETIQGAPGTQLEGYLEDQVTVPAEILAESESSGFALPAALVPCSTGRGSAPASSSGGSSPAPRTTSAAAKRRAVRVLARLRALSRGRLVVSGVAPRGAKLTVKLRRAGRTVASRRVTARNGTYRVTFRVRRARRYSARVTGTFAGRRLLAVTRSARARVK